MFSKEFNFNFNFNFIHSISIYNFTIASTRVQAGEETHKFKEKKGKKKHFSKKNFSNYAYICTCIWRHLKEKVLWGTIMLSEIGKQNKQAKKSFVFACVQVLATRSRHSRGLAAKKTRLLRILRTLREWSRRLRRLRACLHGGGGPQVGEVTRLSGVTRLSI